RRRLAAEHLELVNASNRSIVETVDERPHLPFDLAPRGAQRLHVGKLIVGEHRSRRNSLKSRIPGPLGRIRVRERVAHGLEAAAKIFGELLWSEEGGRIERAVACPVVVVDEGE